MSNLIEIEAKIESLNNLENWDKRISLVKEIKEDIKNEDITINELLNNLDKVVTVSKKKKIEDVITEFDKVSDINKKIEYYQFLISHIKQLENELFTN
jgi:glutaredoxin 2